MWISAEKYKWCYSMGYFLAKKFKLQFAFLIGLAATKWPPLEKFVRACYAATSQDSQERHLPDVWCDWTPS